MPSLSESAGAPAGPAKASSSRLPWIDNLRTVVIMMVVNLHCCITYSHVGDWYVKSATEPSPATFIGFLIWQAHLQAFFMGLLFFIAGYFCWGAWKRRGTATFIRERFFRLGLPTLFFMLAIQPFIILGINPWHAEFPPFSEWYTHYLIKGNFLSGSGPLWFTFALLIFSVAWAGLGRWRSEPEPDRSQTAVFSFTTIGLFALCLGLGSFLVRLVQPIGTNILNLQLSFFTQYLAAFLVGIAGARGRWLAALAASPQARRAGWIALLGGPVALGTLIYFGRGGGVGAFLGGWHWQALGYAVWEQLAGVGLSLGLIGFCFAVLNWENVFLRWLASRSFAVYVLHTPVIIALYLFFLPLNWHAAPMALLLTSAGLVVTFGLADIARRIPLLRDILV